MEIGTIKNEIEKRSLSPSEGYLGNCLYSGLIQCAFKVRQSFTAGLIKKKRVLMCNLCPDKNTVHHDLNLPKQTRRTALKLIGSSPLWLGGLITGCEMMSAANAQIPANVITPEEALKRLMDGNARYSSNQTKVDDFAATRKALTKGQNPFASILSCADSRVSPELCFDQGRGNLFVNRIAGNYVNDLMIANIEYGVAVLNAPLIMVLGHTECGAVKAAIDAADQGTQYPGHIQTITTALSGAVQAGKKQKGNLMNEVIRANIRISVKSLQNSTPLISKLVNEKKVMVVGGIYDLATGKIELVKV